MKIRLIIGLLFAILMINSCGRGKTGSMKLNKDVNEKNYKKHIAGAAAKWNHFTAKFKIIYKVSDHSTAITGNLRMQRDSIIWINITYLGGIEVGRGIIVNDSVKILDKINRCLLEKDNSILTRYLGNSFSMHQIQDLFCGNSLFHDSVYKWHWKNDDYFGLQYVDSIYNVRADYQLRGTKLHYTEIVNKQINRSSKIRYSDYKESGNQYFPHKMEITIPEGNDSIKIDFEFLKIDVNNPNTYPFNIPKSFGNCE